MSDMSDTPRRWPFWLIVSLLANMILVGLLAGFLLACVVFGTVMELIVRAILVGFSNS